MAKKTNIKIGNYEYAKTSTTIGQPIGKNGKPIAKQFYGESMKEAQRMKEEYLCNLNSLPSASVNPNEITFGVLFDNWFWNVLRLNVSDSTMMKYETIKRLRIENAPYYKLKVVEVNSIMVQIHYSAVAKESSSKVVELNKLISGFSKYCYEQGYIKREFTLGVVIKKGSTKKSFFEMDDEDDEELLFLSDEFQKKLVLHAQDNPNAFIYVFLLSTGLRVGEAFALEPRHIDGGYVKVKKTLKKVKNFDTGEYYLSKGPLKTKSSKRNIKIPDYLMPMITRHISEEKKKHFSKGVSYSKESYFFTTSALTPMDYSNFRRYWKEVLNVIDEPYIKPHALRHTYCSNLLKSDVQIKQAALLMGHSTTKLVDKVYSHFTPVDLSPSVDKLNARMINIIS